MSEIKIRRKVRAVTLTLGTATGNATVMRLTDMAGGVISVGTMSSAASQTLQLWGSIEEDGPYRQVHDDSGSPAVVTLSPSTAEGRLYVLPDAVYGVPYLRIISGSTNTTSLQAVVSLKS
jgi:hypothetical protein